MTRRRPPPRPGQINPAQLVIAFSRLPRTTQLILAVLLGIAAIVAGVVYLRQDGQRYSQSPPHAPTSAPDTAPATRATGATHSPHLLLGNPSSATTDPNRRDNYLIVRPAYALAYNNALGTARWVSWRVVRNDFGQTPRELTYPADPLLPKGFKRIGHRDYIGSGFDRGHLCPAGDRGGDPAQSSSTFYTTNIIPQAANLNQKAWNNLETYTRDLVGKHRQRVYVIAGPNGQGGTGLNGFKTTIADGDVTVPAECWKIVVAIPDRNRALDEPSHFTPSTRVIAVLMPNDQSKVGEEWASFRTTPAEIERKTGLTFFTGLETEVAQSLRQKLDQQMIPPPKPYQPRGKRD